MLPRTLCAGRINSVLTSFGYIPFYDTISRTELRCHFRVYRDSEKAMEFARQTMLLGDPYSGLGALNWGAVRMILDTLNNLKLYLGIHPNLPGAFRLLQAFSAGEEEREPGRYEIEGSEVFYLVQTYAPRNRADALWEAHRKYIDLQFMASGRELMGYQRLDRLVTTTPYNEQKDAEMLDGEGSFFQVETGMFCLFFPQDAHMPSLQLDDGPDALGADENVKKVVVKLPVLSV